MRSPPRGLHEVLQEILHAPPIVQLAHNDNPTHTVVIAPPPLNTNGATAQKVLHAPSSPTAQHNDLARLPALSSLSSSTSCSDVHDARRVTKTRLRDGQRRPRCRAAHAPPVGARARHNYTIPPDDIVDEAPPLTIVSSRALVIHLTRLRAPALCGRPFRTTADRAIRLLLEESLARAPIRRVEIVAADRVRRSNFSTIHPACAMVMGECGYPLLDMFRAIQPESPAGFMTLERDDAENVCGNNSPRCDGGRVKLRKLCAPVDVERHSLFLLDVTCASALEACVGIRSLIEFGVQESSIFFVTLVISAAAVAEIGDSFPSVHIVTAAVDPEMTLDGEILLGLSNFQERYFETTTIRQSDLGSSVEL